MQKMLQREPNLRNCALDAASTHFMIIIRMLIELRRAQKPESVGQLAAGIAHEINTPIQYIGPTAYDF
jgi:signal transduction histidine kinase